MDDSKLLVTGTWMDLCPIEAAQIEVARTSSAKDKAARALILHAVKETKAMHILRRGVALSLSAFSVSRFVVLGVVSSDLLELIRRPVGYCQRVLADAPSIDEM